MTETKPYPYLAPCPFCTIDLMEVAEEDGGLVDLVYPINKERTLYTVNCPEYAGGCNASMLGGTREEAIAAWNRRVAFQRPYGLITELTRDELFKAYMEQHEILKEYMLMYHKAGEREFIADKKRKNAERELAAINEKLAAVGSLLTMIKSLS